MTATGIRLEYLESQNGQNWVLQFRGKQMKHDCSAVISLPETGNFSKCGNRFSGKTTKDVQAFIYAVTVYKECVQIRDANALKWLPMLFDSLAATWFQGAKSLFQTCNETIDGLKNAFGKKLPPHRIFRDLFAREQRDDKPTNVFVSTACALLAELPKTPVLDETHKLNMIYGLLSSRIRKKTGPHTTSRTAAVTNLEVLCLDTGEQIPRPLIKVDVVGLHGFAYVDSKRPEEYYESHAEPGTDADVASLSAEEGFDLNSVC
ncbi:hypothetical protein ILUMI_24532 [Ignelater luminosus]|uniref:Retrotransposon gag domain-containing protein n=1 Tax=Ignelater luminosus TaxID=2038154 RepID=A0A8K0C649_IGNLU|nr:hypothetical protein ILUMI_24532 [Ignelater luminosus]